MVKCNVGFSAKDLVSILSENKLLKLSWKFTANQHWKPQYLICSALCVKTEVWSLYLPFLGHQNLHRLICKVINRHVASCWMMQNIQQISHSTHKHTVISPKDLLLFFCMRQRTIRLRMRRAMKAIAPPVTIPSMGTSTRDCRNSGWEMENKLKEYLNIWETVVS